MSIIGRVFISDHLANRLGIASQSHIQVRVGCIIVTSELVIRPDTRSTYMLSPALAQALHIRKHKKLQIRYDKQAGLLHLGPTVGILTTGLPNRGECDPTSLQAELVYLSQVARSLPGQIYIFTPASINWSNLTARGFTYRHISPDRGTWVSAVYPLPDVVYDRVSSRKGEAREQIRYAKNRLMQQPYLKYFNPSFLNKWKVHEMLLTNPQLHKHLPETRPLTTDNLNAMLKVYPSLYVKPSNGSLGLGIINIKQDKKGVLNYVVHRRRRYKSMADNATEFMSKTRTLRSDKAYIVQQGIPMATYQGSPFDIRIIYQKDREGNWQIGKKFARVAARGSSVSNLSSGGRAVPTKLLMKVLFRKAEVIEEKNQQIKEVCRQVAATLEKSTQLTFGELGLDLGIDKNGNIWLIEVNSKPRKTTETEMSQVIMRNTFKRPLEYGIFLAGFS